MYTFSRTGNTAVPGKPGVASVLCLLARGDRVKCEAQNRVLSSCGEAADGRRPDAHSQPKPSPEDAEQEGESPANGSGDI